MAHSGKSHNYRLVFDLRHVGPVVAALRHLGITPGPIVEIKALDLGRVSFTGPGDGDEVEIEAVLASVRALNRLWHSGWEPVVGKDRLMGRQHGDDQDVEPLCWHVFSEGDPEPAEVMLPRAMLNRGDPVGVGILDTALRVDPFGEHGGIVDSDGHSTFRGEMPNQNVALGHATFVGGLVRAAAPSATLVARQVLSPDEATATSWDVAAAAAGLADSETVRLLNLSLGCYTADGHPPLVLDRMVARLSPRLPIVAAAGNKPVDLPRGVTSYYGSPVWPAALPDVIAVTASSPGDPDQLAEFCPAVVPWIDLLAAGSGVSSAYLSGPVTISDGSTRRFNGAARWSGTSFAAAAVSGHFAARMSDGESAADIYQALRKGMDDRIRPFPSGDDTEA